MIQTSLNYQFFQKYIELYWIIYFVFFFKNIDIEYFFTNKKFKTYLISLYSLILIGIMIYKYILIIFYFQIKYLCNQCPL